MNSYDYPPPLRKTQPRRNPPMLGMVILIVVSTLVLVGVGVAIFAHPFSHSDSGVTACQQLGHNTTKVGYETARKKWSDSKYQDLRTAGTAVVDTAHKMDGESDQTNNEDLNASLTDLATLKTQWAALQTACKNHGVPNVPDIT